jgi:hypothetical protein
MCVGDTADLKKSLSLIFSARATANKFNHYRFSIAMWGQSQVLIMKGGSTPLYLEKVFTTFKQTDTFPPLRTNVTLSKFFLTKIGEKNKGF